MMKGLQMRLVLVNLKVNVLDENNAKIKNNRDILVIFIFFELDVSTRDRNDLSCPSFCLCSVYVLESY